MLRVLEIPARSRDQQPWKWAGGGPCLDAAALGHTKYCTYAQHLTIQVQKPAAYKTRIKAAVAGNSSTRSVCFALSHQETLRLHLLSSATVPLLSPCDMVPLNQSVRRWRG